MAGLCRISEQDDSSVSRPVLLFYAFSIVNTIILAWILTYGSLLVFPGPCDFFRLEHHLFLACQFLLHFLSDQVQMTGVRYKVQVIGRDSQYGAKGKVIDPGFVKIVQSAQVIRSNRLLVGATSI